MNVRMLSGPFIQEIGRWWNVTSGSRLRWATRSALQCIQSVVLDVPNLSEVHAFADVEHSFTGEVVQRGRRSTKLVRYNGLGMQIATDLVG